VKNGGRFVDFNGLVWWSFITTERKLR